MYYLNSQPINNNYGNPHTPARAGDIELPDSLLADYTATKGFAILTIEDGTITAVSRNDEAYNAYEAEHPETPPPPTDIERIEAQALFTAVMTDTLLEG